MKPLKLSAEAFGPFAQRLELDFNILGQRSFFLIHGPTGSGKTTILDAICFALYGVTSSDERLPRQMRSQYSGEAVLTEVTLEFSLGKKNYRVTRRPEQTRSKKRGQGLTRVPPSAVLWQLPAPPADEEEGKVLADRWTSVTEEVERLLGFKSEQFRQVIVLPQGRFRRFLLANSRQREDILETLFSTEIYRHIEEDLSQAANTTLAALNEVSDRRKMVLEQAGVESEDELNTRRREMEELIQIKETSLPGLRAKEKAAREELSQAEKDAWKLKELDDARQALNALKEKEAFFEKEKSRLNQAQKAGQVSAAENILLQLRGDLAATSDKLKAADKTVAESVLALDRAERNLALEKARENETFETARRLAFLEDLGPRVAELTELRKQDLQARQAVDILSQKLENQRQDLGRITDRLSRTEKTRSRKELESRPLMALRLECRQIAQTCEQFNRLKDLSGLLARTDKKKNSQDKKIDQLEQALNEVRLDWEAAQTAWREGQAAVLARELEPGQPCPVCGSTEHPAPAVSEVPLPSEKELKSKQQLLNKLEKERQSGHKSKQELEREITGLVAQREEIIKNLGPWGKMKQSEVEQQKAAKEKELLNSEAAQESLGRLDNEISGLKNKLLETEKQLTDMEKKFQEAGRELAKAEARLKDRERQIPKEFRSPEALTRARAETARQYDLLKKQMAAAQDEARKAGSALAAAQASLEACRKNKDEAEKRLRVQEEYFRQSLTKAGFKDEDGYRAAFLPEEQIDTLEQEIKRFTGDLQAAGKRVELARQAAVDITPPDMPVLHKRAEEAKQILEQELLETARLSEQKRQLDKHREKLSAAAKELKILDEHYLQVGRLSDVAAGKNPWNLTFQRYVQAALLDDVLLAATERLKVMSAGRYQLLRSALGQDRRTAWGLDLQVLDAYTGQTRPVATLSGGESFLSALSLALGLADVVQSHSGGIHLETIFVDEGFGSLDPEALDLALRALIDLQQGGRLVGLISHVPELRERIGARLQVISSRSGSSARFILE